MPEVNVHLPVRAPIERVWESVVDIERYHESLDSVRSATIVEQLSVHMRRAAWSVLLKGSILEWEEEEHLDPVAHTIDFKQLCGDLEYLDGHWALKAIKPEHTMVAFEVRFEIGIPLLADMLNPAAQRALQENCTEMVRGIERTTAVG
jgi:ribosome-associated toxin RatA of RatAB toxin-antitoxin module